MCGIAGAVWESDHLRVDPDSLDRMTDALAHRGPDGRDTLWHAHPGGGGVALGHRRLSIIDLAGGTQPMSNEDATVWITFNGEIYNYRELRDEMVSKGHQFRTNSDTETIVHLYEEYGIECLQRLRGMFAFAIWDASRRRLFVARDRLGQKPLVYQQESDRLLFASEIKSLLQVPGVKRTINLQALDDYLTYGYVPHPRTMFEGIHKLPPAHYGLFEQGRLQIHRYWEPPAEADTTLTLPQLREQLDAVLSESVQLRLRSDVPLGAFLSGGIDSTTIVGLMQRHLDRAAQTYTIGFPCASYDESAFARSAADFLHTDHHHDQVQPDSVGLLPTLAWHFDEPFADSSAVPTYYVAQMARRHVTVALTGDGGDELFAGYPRYRTVNRIGLFDRLPGVVKQVVANQLWNGLPNSRESSVLAKLRFRMQILRQTPDRRYLNWVEFFREGTRQQLYSSDVASQLRGHSAERFVADAMAHSGRPSAGARAMHTDLQTYLPCDLLAKVDITSMAHGLECRSPFLDHKVVETAATIPFHLATQGGDVKPLLTSTFAELIPPDLRNRPKMGFSIPLDRWFRSDLREFVHDTLLGEKSTARGYFEPAAVREIIDTHNAAIRDNSSQIWSLLFLEMWHRTYIDPPVIPPSPAGSLTPLNTSAGSTATTSAV